MACWPILPTVLPNQHRGNRICNPRSPLLSAWSLTLESHLIKPAWSLLSSFPHYQPINKPQGLQGHRESIPSLPLWPLPSRTRLFTHPISRSSLPGSLDLKHTLHRKPGHINSPPHGKLPMALRASWDISPESWCVKSLPKLSGRIPTMESPEGF